MTTKMMNDFDYENEHKENNVIVLRETLGSEIDEFLMDCKKRSIATYDCYKSDIMKLADEMFNFPHYKYITKEHFEELGVDDLIKYFNTRYSETDDKGIRKYANSTINRRISSLKSLIKYLAGRKKINYDVTDLYHFLKSLPDEAIMIDILSDEDSDRCIEYFKTLPMGEAMYRLGNLAVDTALRINELLTLEWNQFTVIDEDNVVVKSRGKNKGKGKKDWEKTISTDLYNELLEIKREDDNKVFDISYSSVVKYMSKTLKKLGLDKEDKNYSFHSFRKNSVTFAYKTSGNDIMVAKAHANHSSIDTTTRYINPSKSVMTGRKSLGNKIDENAYKKVSHEELVIALSKVDKSLLFLLNKELSQFVGNDNISECVI